MMTAGPPILMKPGTSATPPRNLMTSLPDETPMKNIENTTNAVTDTPSTPDTPKKSYLKSRHVRNYASLCGEAGIVHDMTGTPTFSSDFDKAPLPVLIHYGARPLHRIIVPGTRWDHERLRNDLRGGLLRGDTSIRKGEMARRDMIFGTRQGTFLHYDAGRISIYAATPRRAMLAALRLERYVDKSLPEHPAYNLLRQARNGMETQEVEMKDVPEVDDETLALHYGEGFPEWNDRLVKQLCAKGSGLSILEGPPGTGKTSYLRQLMLRLKSTHRFYFVPPTHARMVNDPDFIGFWEGERRRHSEKKFVMILEDSEKALMKREDDNRSQVSALLNITDGLLADFLKLQVICTINCMSSELDQALLRPGRLIAHKIFGRISHDEAQMIAKKLGKTLPLKVDYSLAEIFNEAVEAPEKNEKTVGFAA
jgi:ATPase family associated with various cellular activities (AAA)